MKLFEDKYDPTYPGIYGLIPLDGIKIASPKTQ
jgi:hypothetical protein